MMLKSRSFRAGIHPPSLKITAGTPIERANLPHIATILLHQHVGAPCKPLVNEGDEVHAGQKIGDSTSFVSAPVHASISGLVKEISAQQSPLCREVLGIVIESDGRDEWVRMEELNPQNASKREILARIREAGIVGLGGAAFPTAVKLSPPEGKTIDTVILNGAECEPGITADHRLMLEQPEKILKGMQIIMELLEAERGFIGIEDNKRDAIQRMHEVVDREGDKRITVIPLETKYPQGEAGTLIKTVIGRETPSGSHSYDIGVIVHNVATAKAIHDAVYEGIPLIERVVTVTGDVKAPKNLLARIGTPIFELIEACGGLNDEVGKILSGGLMQGIAEYGNVPTIKSTNCIIVLTREKSKLPAERTCIRCGRCVEVCPIGLIPTMLGKLARERRFDECIAYHIQDCMGCGSCTYVCPSKIPITQLVSYGKEELKKRAG
ncbi:MAG: electron transport complex subunit RsxC [Methanophagales archaeon ANME-1-THS]|nr:MAG: electron transport complex subunit RsxC [Methanophagales archaeon ANME-1-THS]